MQQFLRGPEREMTYTRSGTFSNIQHARNFSYKYFAPSFSRSRHFSARSDPGGRGRSAYVCITKSKERHERKVRAYEEDKAEAAVLLALLGSGNGTGTGSGGGGGSGSGGDGGAAAAARARASGPLNSVSGTVGDAPRVVVAAGSSKADERRRAEVEVVDLCDSP